MKLNEDYHRDTRRISKSGLDLINKSPAHYWDKYLNPVRPEEKKTAALIVGNAFHVLTLEAEKFPHHFIVKPEFSGKGSVAKKEEFESIHVDKTIITMDQYDTVRRMRDSVHKHPVANQLLVNGQAERTIKWEELTTDAPCKCRVDWWDANSRLIVDLKSTEDASPDGFSKSAFKYRYPVQGAFYLDGALANGLNPQGFVFIAVEKTPPYLLKVFYMTDELFDFGRSEYRRNLQTYMECRATNQWSGYSVEAEPLQFPAWMRNRNM
jgi:hypothetical protein